MWLHRGRHLTSCKQQNLYNFQLDPYSRSEGLWCVKAPTEIELMKGITI